MTQTLTIAGVAVLGAFLSLLLRRLSRETAMVCAMAAGTLTLLMTLHTLTDALGTLRSWAANAGMTDASLTQMMRILSTALVIELAAQLCRDAGEDSLAQKTLLAGQWILLGMTVPQLVVIGDSLLHLLPKG